MEAFLLQHEAAIRYYAFLGAFAVVALWESFSPRATLDGSIVRRWIANSSLAVLANAALVLVYPAMAVSVAIAASENDFGLLTGSGLPGWAAFALAFLALDLGRYVQHRLMHRIALLWRLHRVHHSDVEYDLTTGLRFHPLEGLATAGSNLALVAALGAPPLAVLAIETLYLVVPLFNHGNLRLPKQIDKALRLFLVTPEVHRIHHSARLDEAQCNFGGLVPWWDWLFGTYRAKPECEPMTMGLADLRDDLRLARLLALPFARERPAPDSSYAGKSRPAYSKSGRDDRHQRGGISTCKSAPAARRSTPPDHPCRRSKGWRRTRP